MNGSSGRKWWSLGSSMLGFTDTPNEAYLKVLVPACWGVWLGGAMGLSVAGTVKRFLLARPPQLERNSFSLLQGVFWWSHILSCRHKTEKVERKQGGSIHTQSPRHPPQWCPSSIYAPTLKQHYQLGTKCLDICLNALAVIITSYCSPVSGLEEEWDKDWGVCIRPTLGLWTSWPSFSLPLESLYVCFTHDVQGHHCCV